MKNIIKNRLYKKVLLSIAVITMAVFIIPQLNASPDVGPYMEIGPNNLTVMEGNSVNIDINYSGNVSEIGLSTGSVVLKNFTANKSISGSGYSRVLTLSNIKKTGDGAAIVSVTGGTAVDGDGDLANSASVSLNINSKDTVAPKLVISNPSPSEVYNGEKVTYTLSYSDDVGISEIGLSTGSIVLNGFTADRSISGSGNTRVLTLTNIQGSVGGNKTVTITGGTAVDEAGNLANKATSPAFTINEKKPEPEPNPNPEPNPENNSTSQINNNTTNVTNNTTNNITNEQKPSDWVNNPYTGK